MSVVWELGLVEYGKTLKLQRRLYQQRLMEEIPDTLLLLEHPPTITIGKSASIENILVFREALSQKGVSLFIVDRGGDVASLGMGQIVGYPIMDLKQRGRDIRRFIYDIQEMIIRMMNDFSIQAVRDHNHPGVVVNGKEIAAIGITIRRWISMHGFTINVDHDIEYFSYINPCGFKDRKATSMFQLLGAELQLDTIRERLIFHFSDIFDSYIELKTNSILI